MDRTQSVQLLEQKATKDHTFVVLIISDDLQIALPMWATVSWFLILVLPLYKYKDMPHNNLSPCSLILPN